jgi:pimeloyl-ACP methyl ester carboxylesterase
MSYELITEYISQMIDMLDLDSTYIMGWSDGGIVGLLLAEKRPDKVRRVLASGANYNLKGALPPGVDISMLAPQPLEKWEASNKEWVENYMKAQPRDWKKLRNDLNNMWYQEEYFPKSVLEHITIPVMIATGDRDDIALEHSIEMYRLIGQGQLCVIPNTSHDVFGERADLINKIALDFFPR